MDEVEWNLHDNKNVWYRGIACLVMLMLEFGNPVKQIQIAFKIWIFSLDNTKSVCNIQLKNKLKIQGFHQVQWLERYENSNTYDLIESLNS